MVERVGEYSRKGYVEEIEGTRKGFLDERVEDYSTVERAMWKKEIAPQRDLWN